MTVSTTSNRIVYTGNGATTAFAFPYKFITTADLKVYVGGILQTTGYTVGTPSDTGANVTFSSAPANGAAIILLSDPARLQGTSLPSTGPFPAKSVETMSDKLTLLVQRLYDLASRSLTLNDADSTTANTTLPTPAASQIIGWDSTGSGLQNVPLSSLATSITYGTARSDIFTGDGTTKTFMLSANPGAQANLDVAVAGVTQLPSTDYTWSTGTSLVFSSAPPNGAKILARYMQGLAQGTSDSASAAFVQAGAGAVSRTAQDKMREFVSILDFGADKTGVALCNSALDAAKAVSNTIYFPPGVYRIENYSLQDLRLIGAGTDGANYGVFTTIIEGSGDIFVQANNFSLEHLTIRNSASGTLGKLITVKDIDTGIGPISHCNFLRANYHIYSSSATKTIVAARIYKCLFREAVIYSRYYANAGLFSYSELSCYTQANKRGLFLQSTSGALIADAVFEFHDEGAIYVQNTVSSSDVIRDLKFQNIHFEHNGNVTPSADVVINVTPSLARIEFDSCGFYASTLAENVDLSSSPSLRIFEHNCKDLSYNNLATGSVITQVMPKVAGATPAIKVSGGDFITDGTTRASAGFTNNDGLFVIIYNTTTPTPVAVPPSYAAKLVVVKDATSGGAALLLLTNSAVNVITTTIGTVTFSIVSGYLNGITTGGSSFRNMYFAQLST